MYNNKLFDIVSVIYTDTERSVTIQANNQTIVMKLEPTYAAIVDNDLWIFNERELGWIYNVWPDTRENELFYSAWGCAFFARFIWCSKSVFFQLPIKGIDFDDVTNKLQNDQTIRKIFEEFICRSGSQSSMEGGSK